MQFAVILSQLHSYRLLSIKLFDLSICPNHCNILILIFCVSFILDSRFEEPQIENS